jgi:probable rRNA maturation factor
MQDNFSIANKTKKRIPVLPFRAIKNDILGKNYSLSLAFVDKKTSRKINKTYRKKDKATNVLSFTISKSAGEIVLCPNLIEAEAKNKEKNFNKNYRELLGFLVIHGMLHLKGMQHSSKMNREEKKYDQKYFYRDRHRIRYDQSHSRGVRKGRKKS